MLKTWKRQLLFAALLLALMPLRAMAAELVVFERDGCPWCVRWNREVGSIYDKTDEAQRLPLRRVNLDRGTPQGLRLDVPVRFTPTFVVVERDQEIGRITGYINDDTFWGLLGTLIAKLPPPVAESSVLAIQR